MGVVVVAGRGKLYLGAYLSVGFAELHACYTNKIILFDGFKLLGTSYRICRQIVRIHAFYSEIWKEICVNIMLI